MALPASTTLPAPASRLLLRRPALTAALSWPRLALFLVLALSAGLELIGLQDEGYGNTYYAAGVKSMLASWHNFFFVSFDAGGFVSLDKPPLGFWIETASARLFGFSGLSILAPEAVAGVLSVLLLYYLVSRLYGAPAGLIAALVLAVTPISAIVDRNNTVDSLLIFTLLLGAWAVSLAAERGSLRWLLCAALCVALGFNIKMLQAYLVVPAYGLTYLLCARVSWRRRILHLLMAAIVLLVVSFLWIAIVDMTPAGQRPFVSDSGTNSELSLVLGYNGLGRLTQALFPGVTHISIFGDPIDLTIVPAFAPEIGNPGWLRLIGPAIAGQASWFLLPALLGLLALLRWARPGLTGNPEAQAVILWGGWLLTAAVFFSTSRFFHLYYLAMIAPPIAALSGIGLVVLWREYQLRAASGRRFAGWRGWLLPVTLLATGALQVSFLNGYPSWSFWLAVLVIGGCVLAAVILMAGRLGLAVQINPGRYLRVSRPIAIACLLVGLLALLLAPTTWAVAAIANGEGGAWLPQAGPMNNGFGGGFAFGRNRRGGFSFGGANGFRFNRGADTPPAPGGATGNGRQSGAVQGIPFAAPGEGSGFGPGFGGSGARFGVGGGGGFGGGFARGGGGASTFAGSQVPALDPRLLAYLKAHQGSARFLVATTTSSYASLFILGTNQPAMALGGYQGWDRILTLAQLQQLVKNGTVRFFYLSPARSGGSPQFSAAAAAPGHFTTPGGNQPAASQNLANVNNDLVSWVEGACTAVPAQQWQTSASGVATSARGFGGPGGGMQLYDCGKLVTGK
jgi:4-amino-4-deoxy-L-arabinose transferase-like glycosyltransferase